MKEIPAKDLLKRLNDRKVKILTDTEVLSIEHGSVLTKDRDGNRVSLPADSVILSVGSVSENSLLAPLREKVPEVYPAGDAVKPGNAGDALRSAARIALEI